MKRNVKKINGISPDAIYIDEYKSFKTLQDIGISKQRRIKLLKYIGISVLCIIYFCAMNKN